MVVTVAKVIAAIILNIASGRYKVTPMRDYLDTAVMDMECDADPDCEITIPK